MKIIHTHHPDSFRGLDTTSLRRDFLLEGLFVPDAVEARYWEVDRTIIGGAVPTGAPLKLQTASELKTAYFCERREVGLVNLGGPGTVRADGQTFALGKCDFAYLGRGAKEVAFASDNPATPAAFYFVSYPAHAVHPSRKIAMADAKRTDLGASETCNRRSIYRMIDPEVLPTCQILMGFTVFERGSIWNTCPPHTHTCRSEVYLYFDVPADQIVMHFLGQPTETRHVVVRDKQAALSPGWSIHMGTATASYGFIWVMGGENQNYADMDPAPLKLLA